MAGFGKSFWFLHNSDAGRELPHEFEQARRLLDLRKVAGFGDELETSVRERLGIDTTIIRVYHAITLSPNNEGRDSHPPEAPPQPWITHPLPLIIDVAPLQVCCAAVRLLLPTGRPWDSEGRRVVEAES